MSPATDKSAQAPVSIWRRMFGGLRTRLTLAYAGTFIVLLVGMGLLLREALEVLVRQQTEMLLTEEWNVVRGHLHIPSNEVTWRISEDSAEQAFLQQMRGIVMVMDAQGKVVEESPGYHALRPESMEEARRVLATGTTEIFRRRDASGDEFLVRAARLMEHGKHYVLCLGYPISETETVLKRLVRVYFGMLPVALLVLIVLGWYLAGRALRPVNDLAKAAQIVTGENLSLRIPPRGSGDEIDTLIRTFNGMMERLGSNFEQLRQFSMDASHELRTPLTAVRGQLEVALMTAHSEDELRDAIVTALQDVERLGAIVRSLLLLSQVESGQILLQKKPEDLTEIIRRVIDEFQIPAAEKSLRLNAVLPESCPAEVDRLQFERMLSNLLSNSVKYTQEGGEVRVLLARSGEMIYLTVADNGPGIPAAHLPKIFDRFYRVREGDRDPEPGSGLGLSFVAWIVKAHGGTVEAKSDAGCGATFLVSLPAGFVPVVFPVLTGGRN